MSVKSRPNPPAGRPADRVMTPVALTCDSASFSTTTVERKSARPSAARTASLRTKLSDRDLALLQSLATLRLMTGGQIQRLHVADGSPATQARRTRALLQRLAELKLLVRLGRQVGGVRAGSSGYVIGLSGHGQAVLGLDGLHGGRRRRVWETKVSFQDHVLAVSDLYVSLAEAERTGKLELLDFEAEPRCWRRFPGIHGQTITLKPDAFVRLGVGDMEYSAFIEVDMGTESGPTIARKCDVYARYWNSGIEQGAHGVFPRVLWLANSEHGADRITSAVVRQPRETQHLFHVVVAS